MIFNVLVLLVLSFGKYIILTYTERYQRSFEVAQATYMYIGATQFAWKLLIC